jgi:hypothetical protein
MRKKLGAGVSIGEPTLLSADANGEILLTHTVIAVMGTAVTVLLFHALLQLRRNGESLPGLLAMIWFMLVTEALRLTWLGFLWFSRPAPQTLDELAFITSFVVFVGIPITVSGLYLPHAVKSRTSPRRWISFQSAMVVVALAGFGVLLGAIGFRTRAGVVLGPASAYMLMSVLLVSRISFYRHLQFRRRPLLLFAGFMSGGLLVVATNSLYSLFTGVRVRQSLPLTILNGFGLILILSGVVFLFANLRLADVVVKRTLRIVAWTWISLSTWLLIENQVPFHGHDARVGFDLACLLVVGLAIAIAPAADRQLNLWVDKWVFEQPDFRAAVAVFWSEILDLENQENVFDHAQGFLKESLRLGAVRILPLGSIGEGQRLRAPHPGPYFTPPVALGQKASSAVELVVPLFIEGKPEYAVILCPGLVRPPLTFLETDFVERVVGRMQVKLGMLAAQELAQREASFREQLTGAELRALRAQVNPHFLFNSLNTIADLTVVAPDKAEEMTIRLAAVFRYVLVNTDRHFISLKEEVEFARSYLLIEQTRFGDRLKVNFELDAATLEQEIPTLLLQPLIENALKHGLAPRREGGTLTIRTQSEPGFISIFIIDDGIGIHARSGSAEPSTHVGVENVSNRLRTAYSGRASFTLRQREQGGTEASIVIPRGQQS